MSGAMRLQLRMRLMRLFAQRPRPLDEHGVGFERAAKLPIGKGSDQLGVQLRELLD